MAMSFSFILCENTYFELSELNLSSSKYVRKSLEIYKVKLFFFFCNFTKFNTIFYKCAFCSIKILLLSLI